MFEVGKKAMAIINDWEGSYRRGDIRVVLAIRKGCCSHRSIELDLGFTHSFESSYCEFCGHIEMGNIDWCRASEWQPLSDMQTELSETTVESILEPELENV